MPSWNDSSPVLLSEAQVTALVPQSQAPRSRLAARQQAILERLHRGARAEAPSNPKLEAVWEQLRGNWSWVVTVPAERDPSTVELARGLAQTGARLSVYPVQYVEATDLDLESSTRLIARLGISAGAEEESSPDESPASEACAPPIIKTIVALESPLARPLALAIAMAADGVVLCVRRGRDRIESVRDTIQAVGRDRIRCCVLIE